MSNYVLEVDSVQKRFGDRLVVSDVWLKCETNDIIGLLGRNGSGKSTLLKIIFGIVTADFKFIKIDDVAKSVTSDLLKHISYLPQEHFIPKHFSVKKAISLTIDSGFMANFYDDEMIQSISNKKINQLSGGELRYLEIKLVLSKKTKFALLDEPYNGLSPIMVQKMNMLILENSKNKGIIVTDHNYENVIKISTKLILMTNGKTHQISNKNELIDKGYLSKGMI